MKLLHISDLHFGEPYLPEVGQALRRSAEQLQPDVIAASGDFTQTASEAEFREAGEFLQSLPDVPKLVTPGNHDVPARHSMRDLFNPFREHQKWMHAELDYHVHLENAVIVSVNSTTQWGSYREGLLSKKQLQYCADIFAKTPEEKLRVVMCHHHLAPVPKIKGGGVMRKAKRTIEFFSEWKVDLILGGHKHRAYIGNSLDFYAGKIRDHGIIIAQCGTSTSRRGRHREREKNTFNWICSCGRTIRIDQYMYFHEANGFEVIARHLFPCAELGYVPVGAQLEEAERLDIEGVGS